MSAGSLYRRYLSLCSHWGIDVTKPGRDLGAHLRNRIKVIFPQGELTQIEDLEKLDKNINSLERLSQNVHYKKLSVSSSASGADPAECKSIVSTDHLEALKEFDEKGVFGRLKEVFGSVKYREVERKPLEGKK